MYVPAWCVYVSASDTHTHVYIYMGVMLYLPIYLSIYLYTHIRCLFCDLDVSSTYVCACVWLVRAASSWTMQSMFERELGLATQRVLIQFGKLHEIG